MITTKVLRVVRPSASVATACLAAMLLLSVSGNLSQAQTAAVALPGGVQDVVKLVKAGISEDVVLAQIKNTGAYYNLNADQIIYLHDQGVSQNEIKALLGPSGAAAAPAPALAPIPPPPATAPVPAPYAAAPAPIAAPAPAPAPGPAPAIPDLAYFQSQLAPYGTWMEVPGYGLCWRPSVETADPFWRPYCDGGYWSYTDDGWYWQSEYPWGNIPFHYGRWYRDAIGWVWAPAYDWAPAWVCWRRDEGACGWAPLPPGAVFRAGVGLWFGGRLAVDVDFGLGADAFVFVSYDHFWDHHLHGFIFPRERAELIFRRSVVLNGYRVEHGRFIVEGLGRDHMARVTHRDIRVEESRRDSGFRGHDDLERRTVTHDDRKDTGGKQEGPSRNSGK